MGRFSDLDIELSERVDRTEETPEAALESMAQRDRLVIRAYGLKETEPRKLGPLELLHVNGPARKARPRNAGQRLLDAVLNAAGLQRKGDPPHAG